MWASVALDVVSGAFWVSGLLWLSTGAPGWFTDATADQRALYTAQYVVFGLLGIVYLRWQYLVHKASEGGGPGMVSPKAGVWLWFVPIANLYIGYAVLRDVHIAAGKKQPLLLPWWVVWIVSSVANNVSIKPLFTDWPGHRQSFNTVAELTGDVLSIVAALMLIVIVQGLASSAPTRA